MPDNERLDHMISKTVHIKPVWGIIVSMALLFSIVAFMLALTGVAAPCNFAHAQTQCSVGDDETFTGPATFEDEINLGNVRARHSRFCSRIRGRKHAG